MVHTISSAWYFNGLRPNDSLLIHLFDLCVTEYRVKHLNLDHLIVRPTIYIHFRYHHHCHRRHRMIS